MFAQRAMVGLCSFAVVVAHAASDVPGVVFIQQSAVALRKAGDPCANFCGFMNAAVIYEEAGCAVLAKAFCETAYLWTLGSRTLKPCAWFSGTCGTAPDTWIHRCADPQTYCNAASVAPPETQRDTANLQEIGTLVGDVLAVPGESARPAAGVMEAVHHDGSIDLGAKLQRAGDEALLDTPAACGEYFSDVCNHNGPYPGSVGEIRGLFLACCKHGKFDSTEVLFNKYVNDGRKALVKADLAVMLHDMDKTRSWTQDEINLMMSAVDYNNDKVIELNEFKSFIKSEEGGKLLSGLILSVAAALANEEADTPGQHSETACGAFAAENLRGSTAPVSAQQCEALKNFETIAMDIVDDAQSAKPSAGGDPHMINMKGERFDLKQLGMVELLRVPRSATTEGAYFTMKANIELVQGGTYMTSMVLQGTWFPNKVIKVSLVDRKFVLQVGNVAQQPPASVAIASEPHSITVSMPTERKATIMIGDACIDIVEAGPPIDYYLSMAATSLTALGFEVGGILGVDSLPLNVRREEASALMAQREVDVIQPVLSYASAS